MESGRPPVQNDNLVWQMCSKSNGCQIQAELESPTSDIDIGDKTWRVHARRWKWTTSAVVHALLFPPFNYVECVTNTEAPSSAFADVGRTRFQRRHYDIDVPIKAIGLLEASATATTVSQLSRAIATQPAR